MKFGSLLIALSFLALWAPQMLLGAPVKSRCLLKCQCDEDCPVGHTCASYRGRLLCRPIAAVAGVPGTQSSTHGSNTGVPQRGEAHPKGKAASELPLPGASLKNTQLTQCHPVSKGPPERGEGTRDNLPPKETAPVPPEKEKLVCKKKPHPEVSTVEAGPVEEPPVTSEEMASSGREESPIGETSRPPDCSRLAARPASTKEELLSDAGHLLRDDITSGYKPVGGSVSASNSPPSKPPLGKKPAFSEDQGLDTGHAVHGRPISSGKSASDGKPTTHPGNETQAISTAGAKPASQPGQGVHREPAPKEKPESAGKPAEKPEPAKQTEEEANDDSSTEAVMEEDEEDNEGEGREPDFGAGSSEGDEDSDAFDKELDYGLNQSPFNPYEYHDAWSEEDSDHPEAGLEDGLAEDTAGLGHGEPVFDVWGDHAIARGLGLELQSY